MGGNMGFKLYIRCGAKKFIKNVLITSHFGSWSSIKYF